MKRLVAVLVLGWLPVGSGSAQRGVVGRQITEKESKAVILAIEDEVYDRGYQKRFYMVGPEMRPGVTRLPLYIEPTLKKDGGIVVYKLMPYGEVIRGFHFMKDGLAVLEGDPDSGFPPTDADTLTLYMDDDDVCRWKHTWKKYHFEITDSPSTERIKGASARQKQRTGYSYQEMPPKEQRAFPQK